MQFDGLVLPEPDASSAISGKVYATLFEKGSLNKDQVLHEARLIFHDQLPTVDRILTGNQEFYQNFYDRVGNMLSKLDSTLSSRFVQTCSPSEILLVRILFSFSGAYWLKFGSGMGPLALEIWETRIIWP